VCVGGRLHQNSEHCLSAFVRAIVFHAQLAAAVEAAVPLSPLPLPAPWRLWPPLRGGRRTWRRPQVTCEGRVRGAAMQAMRDDTVLCTSRPIHCKPMAMQLMITSDG